MVTQETHFTQERGKKQRIVCLTLQLLRKTEILLSFASRGSGVEKWALGSTKCNKGDADDTDGRKDVCSLSNVGASRTRDSDRL